MPRDISDSTLDRPLTLEELHQHLQEICELKQPSAAVTEDSNKPAIKNTYYAQLAHSAVRSKLSELGLLTAPPRDFTVRSVRLYAGTMACDLAVPIMTAMNGQTTPYCVLVPMRVEFPLEATKELFPKDQSHPTTPWKLLEPIPTDAVPHNLLRIVDVGKPERFCGLNEWEAYTYSKGSPSSARPVTLKVGELGTLHITSLGTPFRGNFPIPTVLPQSTANNTPTR